MASLFPSERDAKVSADGSLSEVVCSVEAIPGLWQTGAQEGFVLLAATEEDASLHPRDVVAEVRAGLVETAACEWTVFRTEPQADLRESRGVSKLAKHEVTKQRSALPKGCLLEGPSGHLPPRSPGHRP